MFRTILFCSAALAISASAFAAKPIKPVATTFNVSLASTSFILGVSPADSLQQKSGLVTVAGLGNLKIDVSNLIMVSQLQTTDVQTLGCSVDDELFIPLRGRVSLVDTLTQSAVLFGYGSADDPLQSGICLDITLSPTGITPVNVDFQYQGGTGDFAVYSSGALITAVVDTLAFPFATGVDTLGYVESTDYILTLSP